MIATESRVFVDGALIGLVEDPKDLVQKIRMMRRQGVISTEVNCSYWSSLPERDSPDECEKDYLGRYI